MLVSPFLLLPKYVCRWCEEWQRGTQRELQREHTIPVASPRNLVVSLLSPAPIQASEEMKKPVGSVGPSEALDSSQVFQWENHFDLLPIDYNFGQGTIERT